MNTSQCEQYGGTVHLFIGTGRNPVKITFISLISNYNHDTNYQGLSGLFLFKSVLPFVSDVSSCRSSLDYSFGIYLWVVSAWIWPCRRCFCLEDLRRRRRPPTVALRGARSFFVTSSIRENSKASKCRRSEKHLSWARCRETIKILQASGGPPFSEYRWSGGSPSKRRVVHRSASASDLAVRLPTCNTI